MVKSDDSVDKSDKDKKKEKKKKERRSRSLDISDDQEKKSYDRPKSEYLEDVSDGEKKRKKKKKNDGDDDDDDKGSVKSRASTISDLEKNPDFDETSRGTQTFKKSPRKKKKRKGKKKKKPKSENVEGDMVIEEPLLTDSVLANANLSPASDTDDASTGLSGTESTDNLEIASQDAVQSGIDEPSNLETDSKEDIQSKSSDLSKKRRERSRSTISDLEDDPDHDTTSRGTQIFRRSHSKDGKEKRKKKDKGNDDDDDDDKSKKSRGSTISDLEADFDETSRATQTFRKSPLKKKRKKKEKGEPKSPSLVYGEPLQSETAVEHLGAQEGLKPSTSGSKSKVSSKDDDAEDDIPGEDRGASYKKGHMPGGPDELVPYRPDPMKSSDLNRSGSAHVPFIEVKADKKRKVHKPQETPTTDDQTQSSLSQKREVKPSDSNEALILDQDEIPQPYDDPGGTSLEDTTPRTTLDKSGAQLDTSGDETGVSEAEDASDAEPSDAKEESADEDAANPPDFLAAPQLSVDDEPTSEEDASGLSADDAKDSGRGRDKVKGSKAAPSKPTKGRRKRRRLSENQRFMDKAVLICSIIILAILLIYLITFVVLRSKDHLLLYFAIVNMPRNALTLHGLFVMIIVSGSLPAILSIIGTVKKYELVMRMYLTLAFVFGFAYVCAALAWAGVLYSWAGSFQDRMFVTLGQAYHGELAQNLESVAWNFIQYKHDACGVRDYHEWKSSSWYKSFKFNNDAEDAFIEDYRTHNMGIRTKRPWPLFCCKGIHDEVKEDQIVHRKLTEESFSDEFINTCYTVDGKPWSEDEYTDTSNSSDTGPHRFDGKTFDQGALEPVTDVFLTLFVATTFSAMAIVLLYIICIIFVATLLRNENIYR